MKKTQRSDSYLDTYYRGGGGWERLYDDLVAIRKTLKVANKTMMVDDMGEPIKLTVKVHYRLGRNSVWKWYYSKEAGGAFSRRDVYRGHAERADVYIQRRYV